MKSVGILLFLVWISGCANPPRPPAHGGNYYVSGEVKRPGPQPCQSDADVSWAIKAAGGFTTAANERKVEVTRTNGKTEIVNMKKVIEGKAYDLPIFPGDEIWVRKKSWFW